MYVSVSMHVIEFSSPPCIFSVRAIHLILKVCVQIEHLINCTPHIQSAHTVQTVNMVPV